MRSEAIPHERTRPKPPWARLVENGALAEFASFQATSTPDFTPISTLLNDAIAAHKLPGAVVLIGHNGKVVFEQAYGNRKLAGRTRHQRRNSPAETMTEDTIFDMASLTKCLATATAIMQLYEVTQARQLRRPRRKVPPRVQPPTTGKEHVTIRELLTHYSGLPPDVDLKDPWGLAASRQSRRLQARLRLAPQSLLPAPTSNTPISTSSLLGAPRRKAQRPAAKTSTPLEHIFVPLNMIAHALPSAR